MNATLVMIILQRWRYTNNPIRSDLTYCIRIIFEEYELGNVAASIGKCSATGDLRSFITVVVRLIDVGDPWSFKFNVLCCIPVNTFEHSMRLYRIKRGAEARISDKDSTK